MQAARRRAYLRPSRSRLVAPSACFDSRIQSWKWQSLRQVGGSLSRPEPGALRPKPESLSGTNLARPKHERRRNSLKDKPRSHLIRQEANHAVGFSAARGRSEERRVGKECRFRGSEEE